MGNFASMGRYTQEVPSPGSFTAYSTRSLLPFTVATFSAYCSGARICSRIAPSWISPKMPRVFTLLKTFFRSPTPVASVCISPRPLYTLSNCSLTRLKDCCSFSSSVFCSFSSTVWRISSRRLPLSACMAAMRVSIVVRMFSSFCSLSSAPVFMRCSMNCSWSVTAFCSAVWRTASCSLSSRRRVFCASATCLCAFA